MNKFWKWMKKKEYKEDGSFDEIQGSLYDTANNPVYFTKQMIIGYMIEYIIEKFNKSFLEVPKETFKFTHGMDIEDYYNKLKEIIKNMEI